MSIEILRSVATETRRLAVAGSKLATDDYRLKRQIEPLEKLSAKAPVFGKVAEAVRAVIASDPKSAAEPLLRLATLVQAILATQASTCADGKLEATAVQSLDGFGTQTSFKNLAPVIDALTRSGSGRLEVVREHFERRELSDFRLIGPVIAALGDSFGELADYVAEEVLPTAGPAIIPLVVEGLNPKGGKRDARRIDVVRRIDPTRAREIAKPLVDTATKAVKIALIHCLDAADDETQLLDLAKSKGSDVKEAAMYALAPSNQPSVVAALISTLRTKNPPAEALARSTSAEVQSAVCSEIANTREAWRSARKSGRQGGQDCATRTSDRGTRREQTSDRRDHLVPPNGKRVQGEHTLRSRTHARERGTAHA